MTTILNFKPSANLVAKWCYLDPVNVQYIVVHHAEAKVATVQDINQWHIENGWSGIGYNEYIRKDGTVYICRGDNIGAQCQGWNSKSYGICLEGNYSTETIVPDSQMNALVERIKINKARFNNLVGIVPHSRLVSTECPGRNFPFNKVLELVNKKEVISEINEKECDIMTADQIRQVLGIKDATWAKKALEEAKKSGLINGDHDPNEPVTIGMLVALLNKIYDK